MKAFFKFLVLIAGVISISAFNACSKDDDNEDNPEYVGTWIQTETQGEVSYRLVLTLSKTEFVHSTQIGSGNTFMDVEGERGTISVDEDEITAKTTSIGEYNYTTNKFVWYNEGTDEFEENYPNAASQISIIKYSVSGNQITLIFDEDEDGVYEAEESMVYTRQ